MATVLRSMWFKALMQQRVHTRLLHSTPARSLQRLLWAGAVLDRTSASLSEVPRDWLLSIGVQSDVEAGISFTSLSSSVSHTMLSYRTLSPLGEATSAEATQGEARRTLGDIKAKSVRHSRHKVVAVGRNTFGELGMGFTSQEATWGMVSPGFEGNGGVQQVECGGGSSWIVTKRGLRDSTARDLYAFGNHTSGQLGLQAPSLTSTSGDAQLQLYSAPKRVEISPAANPSEAEETLEEAQKEDVKVESLSSGLDHTLILLRKADGTQDVRSTGVNTDGQLGTPDVRISRSAFASLAPFWGAKDPLVGVVAGGDSSIAWSESGRVWGWGNSEYSQALVDGKPHDRIGEPREASEVVHEALGGAKVKSIKLGGSWCLVLDDQGRVFSAGFGALGLGSSTLSSPTLQQIDALSSHTIVSIGAGLEYAAALTSSGRLFSWGLNSTHGRLGLGPRNPYPSCMIASRFTPDFDEHEMRVYEPVEAKGLQKEWAGQGDAKIVCGRDAMWVLLEDGQLDVGRWTGR